MLQPQKYPYVLLVLVLAFLDLCSATQFIVGDSAGWVIPPYPTYYTSWTDSHFIREGDSLEFNFDTKFYNLIQVSKSEYEHCAALEPLKVFNTSPINFLLKEKDVYYFICSVSNYCSLGQKIMIDVHGVSLQITPAPSASPPKISSRSLPNGYAPQPSAAMIINPSKSIDVPSPTPLGGPASPSSSQGVKYDVDVVLLVCVKVGTFLGFWIM
ncbi:cucumber peeling cupredoxin-like [Vicia villosa]|uniref:cucumber peeling cupredoxin-like n=1 Tax=Vicia villosa TaxID=3911 RepID=UPI00273C9AA0|nr:cucumber peeling cupredoxin-like [Vicia villosa]